MQHKIYKKVVLVILDGFGIAHTAHGNAISQAKTPAFDYLVANFPSLSLQASGPLVGLPWGEMGNSEVGHLNIGAGRIVGQDLPRITGTIQSGEFFKNKELLAAVEHTKKNHSKLHLLGLISSGGVHSFDEHLYALLNLALENGQKNVFIHMFTDGRDTEPQVALESVKKLNERIERMGIGKVATVAGRFYAMDRGGHWAQTEAAYQALVMGQGETASSPEACVRQNYIHQVFDEMIKPTVITDQDGKPVATIAENDAVIFFNFRSDRAVQLTQEFVDPSAVPQEFRHQPIKNLYFVTMTEYLPKLCPHVAFPPPELKNNLAELAEQNHLTQFHIAESEKFAHVTVFFNCGRGDKWPGEDRLIVASPDNAHNYSDQPEMSANEITANLVDKILHADFNLYVVNFANGDMVGHTGNLAAGTKAVESLDGCIKRITEACLSVDAVLMISADHGNIEQMISPKTGDIDKDHTTNPVPFLLVANEFKFPAPKPLQYQSLAAQVPGGVISDIAPTVLEFLNIPKPAEMTGENLLEEIASK